MTGLDNRLVIWPSFAVLCLALFTFSPIHEFELWSQVTYLRGSSLNSSNIHAAHFLRYLLVFPIFIISDIFAVQANLIFRAVCFLNIFLITYNCITITKFYNNNNGVIFLFSFAIFFIFLSIFMNGRMLFSMLGYSYLLSLFHRWDYREINETGLFARFLLALLLCSVSTGTFLLCIVSMVTFSVCHTQRSKGLYITYLILFISSLSPIIILYLMKNINFYGGGFTGLINMLNHGAGTVFHKFDTVTTLLLTSNFFLILVLMIYLYSKIIKYRFLILFCCSGLICGLFGYSTLSMCLIPIFIMVLLLITSTLPKRNENDFAY